MSQYKIIELSTSDWSEYKSIRLNSLQDSPDSFGSTYEIEAAFTMEQWKSRLSVSPVTHDSLALAAVADKSFIGLVSCVIHTSDSKSAHLYQMWVSPNYRGMGVGTALIDRAKKWAASSGVRKLLLSVTTVNAEAFSLYQSIGFHPVGDLEPLREGSSLQSQPMEFEQGESDEKT